MLQMKLQDHRGDTLLTLRLKGQTLEVNPKKSDKDWKKYVQKINLSPGNVQIATAEAKKLGVDLKFEPRDYKPSEGIKYLLAYYVTFNRGSYLWTVLDSGK